MPSVRIVLLFFAILALVLLVVFGDRYSAGFRQRFLSVFPRFANQTKTPTPTMSPTPIPLTVTPRPKSSVKGSDTSRYNNTSEVPATGPESSIFIAFVGMIGVGYWLKRKSKYQI